MYLENVEAILLDIEGTTTPIGFVHKTLFPFARDQMREFLTENFDELSSELAQLRLENKEDSAKNPKIQPLADQTERENAVENFTNYANFLIDSDRKSTPLKSLQGKIWKAGYESGEIVSEVFADVAPAFERWRKQDKTIAIYSSGSVLAQRLLFKHTNYGDLTGFISSYFDTCGGGKKEAESYLKIASEKSFPPVENFLFVSDVEEELDAARQAGMKTLLSFRQGNAPMPSASKHQIIYSFDEIIFAD